jgi:hypothetical protein
MLGRPFRFFAPEGGTFAPSASSFVAFFVGNATIA